jgi:hypothetical protein
VAASTVQGATTPGCVGTEVAHTPAGAARGVSRTTEPPPQRVGGQELAATSNLTFSARYPGSDPGRRHGRWADGMPVTAYEEAVHHGLRLRDGITSRWRPRGASGRGDVAVERPEQCVDGGGLEGEELTYEAR